MKRDWTIVRALLRTVEELSGPLRGQHVLGNAILDRCAYRFDLDVGRAALSGQLVQLQDSGLVRCDSRGIVFRGLTWQGAELLAAIRSEEQCRAVISLLGMPWNDATADMIKAAALRVALPNVTAAVM
jgi:hypothetical protein